MKDDMIASMYDMIYIYICIINTYVYTCIMYMCVTKSHHQTLMSYEGLRNHVSRRFYKLLDGLFGESTLPVLFGHRRPVLLVKLEQIRPTVAGKTRLPESHQHSVRYESPWPEINFRFLVSESQPCDIPCACSELSFRSSKPPNHLQKRQMAKNMNVVQEVKEV